MRLATVLLAATATATLATAQVPIPTLQGPITGPGTPFVAGTSFDLAEVGYQQAEYFISGTASAYTSAAPLGPHGRWSASPGTTAAYKTRILAYRPVDPKRFNGTVVVEWLNVSGGLDSAPDWISAHTELTREGYAWVGVSAQYVGVEGGGGIVSVIELPLKAVDSVRYGSLVHPGDSFSYDIFSQAGQAVRQPAGPLGGLEIERVIAVGESQSAFRMVTYINAIHPLTRLFDGFLVHSRGAGATALSEAPQPVIPAPSPAPIRDDVVVPVLIFETESDLTLLGYYGERQPDTKQIRLWEVAGTAHADTYTVLVGMADKGDDPEAARLLITAAPLPPFIECGAPLNSGPQHFVLKSAFAALDRWVRRGKPPKSAPRLEVDAGPPAAIVRDANGNAVGGIRTPQVDVPLATLSGDGQTGSILCLLFGTTVPFDADTLRALYPSDRIYRKKVKKATKRALRKRFLRKADAKLIKAAAATTNVGQ